FFRRYRYHEIHSFNLLLNQDSILSVQKKLSLIQPIYHNIRCVHRLRRSQGVSDGKPAKQATNHPKTRQKRAGSVFTACMSMRASA
ncbi:hypothetical protein ACQX7J_26500, partial [Klebsiella pneumoniae]|uniref:hypothetical protein n=1 Tax=Klebsiella pneumoniae TaxID=573 RepID=UPI003D1E3A2D